MADTGLRSFGAQSGWVSGANVIDDNDTTKAQGFDYVLDSTQGQGVIFADGKNLIEDVKTELGF